MSFALPNITDTGILGMVQYVDTTTDGLLGIVLLFVAMILTFISKEGTYRQKLGISTYVGALVIIILWAMGLSSEYLLVCVLFVAGAAVASLVT